MAAGAGSSFPNMTYPIGGQAKPSFTTINMGHPPDPDKVQEYPGVERRYLPHEAVIIYRNKLYGEMKAYQTPSGANWIKENRQKKREMERTEDSIRNFRQNKALEALAMAKTPYEKRAAMKRVNSFPGLVALGHSDSSS
eukprot:TRINITY_DN72251_c0_g1_i1.p1 TRINITY_DN72251_c0_g1~~TRINITY_DN72251_c0_g1_i1.p1  ORF type:complete len:161 (+),score=31.07 TRINITY_DN72251_c0_g1_i1:67-483(+)